MHLYIITRGIKGRVDRFIEQLTCMVMPYTTSTNPAVQNVQVGVRPVQFWEVVFPEQNEGYDVMCRTLFKTNKQTQHKRHHKYLAIIRKILGIEPVKPWKKDGPCLVAEPKDVEVVQVGMKKDYYQDGNEML